MHATPIITLSSSVQRPYLKCDDLYLHITNPIVMMRVDRKTASFVSYSDINGAVFDRGGFGTEISTVHKQAGIHCNPV